MTYLPRSLSSFITAAYTDSAGFTLTGTSGSIALTAVPAGIIRVITSLCGWSNKGTFGRHRVRAHIGGVITTLSFGVSPARWEGINLQGIVVLEAGDTVDYWVAGAAVGDEIECAAVGYDIKSESS